MTRALRAAEENGVPPVDAVEPDAVWEALHGQLDRRRALEVVDAALRGPTGFEEVRLALALQEAILREAEPPSEVAGRGRTPVPLLTALVAIAAAVVASVIVLPGRPPTENAPPEYRGDPAAVVPKVEPGAILPADALVLQWESGPPGSKYHIRISTADGRVIATRRNLSEPTFTVASSAVADVASGTTIFWQVEILRPDGSRDRSPTFHVVLR